MLIHSKHNFVDKSSDNEVLLFNYPDISDVLYFSVKLFVSASFKEDF